MLDIIDYIYPGARKRYKKLMRLHVLRQFFKNTAGIFGVNLASEENGMILHLIKWGQIRTSLRYGNGGKYVLPLNPVRLIRCNIIPFSLLAALTPGIFLLYF